MATTSNRTRRNRSEPPLEGLAHQAFAGAEGLDGDASDQLDVHLPGCVALGGVGDPFAFHPPLLTLCLFGETRRILRAHGPKVGKGLNKDDLSFAEIAIAVLNHHLRPFLARWHPILQAHEALRSPTTPPLAHELVWSHSAQLRQELDSFACRWRLTRSCSPRTAASPARCRRPLPSLRTPPRAHARGRTSLSRKLRRRSLSSRRLPLPDPPRRRPLTPPRSRAPSARGRPPRRGRAAPRHHARDSCAPPGGSRAVRG